MAGIDLRLLGDFIRDQRSTSEISLRQLAKRAGVSNPYLSQIERGLRKPSAEILQQIAKGLRISAEALYVQAGILDERDGSVALFDAVHAEDSLSERQKQVLLDIYDSFRKENASLAKSTTKATAKAPAKAPAKTKTTSARASAAATKATPAKTAPAKASRAKATPASKPKTGAKPSGKTSPTKRSS
ncbi:MAG TPA: helix-turn-helix transcriptional regulator [Mycobacteriales bacterium]|nr:helix-turn-helix transcriptional regulator [Mycobacteriales bacterium]